MTIPAWFTPHALPLHTIPSGDSQATESVEQFLIDDPDADLIFLLETTPSGGTTLRLSDVGYITAAADTPASTPYPDRLLSPYNVEVRIPPPDTAQSVGELAFGVIELESGDEDLDARLAESWEGRQATIKVGGTYHVGRATQGTLTFAQFVPRLRGTVQTVGWSDGRIVLTLREVLQQLREPLQSHVYDEGFRVAIQGQRKPLRYGEIFNTEPVLIDEPTQIWQWHDGKVDAVLAVRDQGVALTDAGDVANIFTAGAPAAGTYITQNSGGYIRLGAVPLGRITLDGRGDKTGNVYVNTTAGIAQRMAIRVGLADPADFDGGAFAAFPDASPIGYVVEEAESAVEAIAKLMAGAFGWLSTTHGGLLRIGRYKNPNASAAVVTITDDTLEEIESETQIPPAWRVEVEYARNWTPQDADALSDALSGEDRELYSQPVRIAAYEDAAIKTTHKDARVVTIAGYQVSASDALALATEVFGVLSQRTARYRARVERQMFQRQPGDVVEVISADADLSAGRRLYVTGVAEDAAERSNDWELWG